MLYLTLNFYSCCQLVNSNKLRSTNAQQGVWRYWGLTNIASTFVLYCASVRARRYKFG